MKLHLLLVTLSAAALAGCAGAVGGQRGDPYAPNGQAPATSQPPAGVIGPGQRYPLRTPPPAAPKLTISDESLRPDPARPSDVQQSGASSEISREPLGPPSLPAPVVSGPQPESGPQQELFKPSEIVGRVGDQIILYGEVAPMVNQMLTPYLEKAPNQAVRDEILSQRDELTEQAVRQMVDTKLLYYEFLRNIPRDKLDEAKRNIKSQVRSRFETGLQQARRELAAASKLDREKVIRRDPTLMRLAELMEQQQLETFSELDAALRREGSSLERQITFIMEQQLGQEVIRQKINFKPEVTHLEMLDYYRTHAKDFAVAAKARFEIMTVFYANFPTPQAAEQALAEMGNAVYLGGASFAAVAQKSSQEPGASKGGQYDWTSQGSLASEVVDQAIFTLPVGKLSQILRDERGCHIVRVLERTEAGQIPFTDAQLKIKEAIVSQKRNVEYKKYVEELRASTPVWTIYDDRQVARPPRGAAPR